MKKTKLLMLLSALLVLATVLCACGSVRGASPKKVLTGVYTDTATSLSASTSLGIVGMDVDETGGKFIAFRNDKTYMIYNVETGATVYNVTLGANEELVDISFYETDYYDLGLFTMTRLLDNTATEYAYSTKLFTETGAEIATVSGRNVTVETGADLFSFHGTYYRVSEDKSYAVAFEANDLAEYKINDIEYMTEKYYYVFDNSGSALVFTAYDKEMLPAATYRLPTYANSPVYGVLTDGKVIFQYRIQLPEDAEKYDLFDNAVKYDIVTEIYNVKRQSAKDMDFDYLLMAVSSRETLVDPADMEFLDDSVDIIAVAFPIEDKRVDQTYTGVQYLSLRSNGMVKSSLTNMIDGMIAIPQPVASNRYTYSTLDGRKFLIDEKGKLIGEVSGAVAFTDQYIITDKKLYNYNCEVVYDYNAEDMSYSGTIGSVVFFEKDGATYTFNGSKSTIIAKDENKVLTVKDDYYLITAVDASFKTTYTYYGASGAQLLSTDFYLGDVASYEGFVVLGGLDSSGNKVYYRFS